MAVISFWQRLVQWKIILEMYERQPAYLIVRFINSVTSLKI